MTEDDPELHTQGAERQTLNLPALSELRIVELGSWLAAPSAGAMFADLGAQVLKIEPAAGDPLRRFPASLHDGKPRSPGFALVNRHKKSVVLDVSTENGRAELDAILSTADVFITNMRVGALKRANLDSESIVRRFPKIVYASLTGLGLAGPENDQPGFDTGAFWARSGMLHQVTPEAAEPTALVGGYGDLVTSLAIVGATMAALLARTATGRGGVVETSLLQTGAWLLSGDVVAQAAFGRAPKARPRRETRTPLVNSYRTADGRWFFLTMVEAGRHLESLFRAIEQPQLARDSRFCNARAIQENAAELITLLDGVFAELTLADLAKRFAEAGVWWEKVATPGELMQDPQVVGNNMASDIAWDGSNIRAVTLPFRIFGRQPKTPSEAPALGSHHGGFSDHPDPGKAQEGPLEVYESGR